MCSAIAQQSIVIILKAGHSRFMIPYSIARVNALMDLMLNAKIVDTDYNENITKVHEELHNINFCVNVFSI